MKRILILTLVSAAAVAVYFYAGADTEKFLHFFGLEDEHGAVASTEKGHGHADEHGKHNDEHEKENHAEGKNESEEHEGSEIRLSASQIKLAGIESLEVKIGSLDIVTQLTGEVRINLDRAVEVVPRVPGVVRSVRSFLGDDVKSGEVMAIIDSRELAAAKSEYIASRERTSIAQIKFEREDKLWRKRISSEQDFLDARSALAESKIAERAASQNLRALGVPTERLRKLKDGSEGSLTRFEVIAPFEGTVIEKKVTTGASVDEKEPIYRIADLRKIWVIASVYEKDIAKIERDQTALVTTKAYPGEVFSGHVAWISDTLDERTRTLEVRIEMANEGKRLKPGMFVRATVVVGSKNNVVVIPESAVRRQGGELIAFIDEGDGLFERREIEVGGKSNGMVEVRSGLKAGERVVSSGSFILKSELEKEGFGGGHAH